MDHSISLDDLRQRMVEEDLKQRGISDARVLEAMRRVPRHAFVPSQWVMEAYEDHPLPIGEGQTISQPYIVARMSELLSIDAGSHVLELGTGSGYQTAILAELGAEVWTLERSPDLLETARERLARLGFRNVHCVQGDGTLGLPDHAPFDRILAAGSLPCVPPQLIGQLSPGGIFVGPVGGLNYQDLIRVTYHPTGEHRESFGGCQFVPLIGAAGWKEWQSRLRGRKERP